MSTFAPILQSNERDSGVTTVSSVANTLYTLPANGEVPGNSIWLFNEGSQVAFVNFGNADVAAATVGTASVAGSIPVAPGRDLVIDLSNYTHWRAITASGVTTLNVALGFVHN